MRLVLRGAEEHARAAATVDRYHLWFDLRPGARDMELADAVRAYLDHLAGEGLIEGWVLERRKLGLGPAELGEWHCAMEVRDLAQLDTAFAAVAPRSGEVESLHAAVWSKVVGLRTALYRDFPDPVRQAAGHAQG